MATSYPRSDDQVSRGFTLHDIEENMDHSRQLRSEAMAEMVSTSMRKTTDLIGAIRKVWRRGGGLGARLNRA